MARGATIRPEELLEHAEWVRRLAIALVRDPDAAGDLAQDAMEAAMASPPREAGPVRPWLGGVVRNLARMRWRTDARRRRREALAHDNDDPVLSPEALVERAETQQLVARIVLELSEPLRQTVLLRFYEGLSSAEIARRLDVPAGTVRWRLSRALGVIRADLDREHDGDRKRWALLLSPLAGAPPATAPPETGAAGVLQGALLVKTSTKIIAALVVLALALFASHRAGLWGGGDEDTTATTPATDRSAAGTGPAAAPAAPSPIAGARTALSEDDPVGTLRLEGQVIDADENPVVDATVAIDTNPPRTAQSGDDGSFAFDGLIGRNYGLEARADDAFAGPVFLRLSADTEPLILRVRPAPTVDVQVVSADSGEPVVGAAIEIRSRVVWNAITGADGTASIPGVGPYEPTMRVSAEGFAVDARRLIMSKSGSHREHVALHRGGAVAGTVVDETGKPIAGARVLAIATREPFPVLDPRRDGVLTDSRGRWSVPALAAGSYRFTATAAGRAPGTTTPVSLDGTSERTGVDIELGPGGKVAGAVVDATGTPVIGADVRLVVRGALEWRTSHQAYSDDRGRFELAGLPRLEADVFAAHTSGSSELTPVALDKSAEHTVDLRISITGVIAGVVVDSSGAEIAEAHVIAEPAWSGALGEREAWSARGVPMEIANGGGEFRFVGLPEGDYRLRAARPGAPPSALWLPGGTRANTGASGLRLTVPDSGAVKGKVAFADGAAPSIFTVAVGANAAVPVASSDGAFHIEAPGGTYNLTIAGPEFARAMVEARVAGGVTDLGTITVERGRSLSGRVLDAAGAPVAEATVVAGALLSGDGSKLYIEDESINAKSTTTDDDGRFVLSGFGPHRITAVAGKDGVGRSTSISVPPGPASADVDLLLSATGSLAGTMTLDGKPLAEAVVIANPLGATASNFFVVTGADGSYALDALTPGEYIVYPMLGGGGPRPKDMYVQAASIRAGQRTTVDVAATSGSAELEVSGVTDEGGPVALAQVFAFDIPGISAPTAESMRDGSWLAHRGGDGPVAFYLRTIMAGAPAAMARLKEGIYSVCIVPIPVDPEDMAGMQRAMSKMEELPMKCQDARVTGARSKVTIRVPAAWAAPPDQ